MNRICLIAIIFILPSILFSQSLFDLDIDSKIDINTIESKLLSGADINETNEYGYTFLMEYLKSSIISLDVVKFIIQQNYDITYTNAIKDNVNLLMHAARVSNNPDLIKVILDAGINIQDKNDLGRTALHYSMFSIRYNAGPIRKSEIELSIIEKLLFYGANPNSQDYNGTTPLMMSYLNQCPDVVYILLKYGANPNLVDNRNRTARIYLSEFGSKGFIRQEKIRLLEYFINDYSANNYVLVSTLPSDWKDKFTDNDYLRNKILGYNFLLDELSIDEEILIQKFLSTSILEINKKVNLPRIDNVIRKRIAQNDREGR